MESPVETAVYRRSSLTRTAVVAFSSALLVVLVGSALAENTAQPAAVQPALPRPLEDATSKLGSPVVEDMVRKRSPPIAPKRVARKVERSPHRGARQHEPAYELDRPTLAGVQLVVPLPPQTEPTHFIVPTPAYPLDSLAAAIFTPPPPIVCRQTRRDPTLPDPRLYRERPVTCEPDIP